VSISKNISKYLFILILGSITTFVSLISNAQLPHYNLHKINENGGVRSSDVIAISKDKQGYLWIATQFIVQQFDGLNCVNYNFNERIEKIICDCKNTIWVISRKNLYTLNRNTNQFEKFKVQLPENELIRDINTFNNSLLFISYRKIYKLSDDRKTIIALKNTNYENSPTNNTPFIVHKNKLIYSDLDSVFIYDYYTQEKQIVPIKNSETILKLDYPYIIVSNNRFQSFIIDIELCKQKNITKQLLKAFNTDETAIVFGSIPLLNNKYLLNTSNGFVEYDMRNNAILKPIIYCKGEPFKKLQSSQKSFTDENGDTYFSHPNGIYTISLQNSNIYYLRFYSNNKVQLPSNIRDFQEDEKGNMWLATTKGVFILNPLNGDIQEVAINLNETKENQLNSTRQLLLYKQYCFIGTTGNGIYVFNRNNKKTTRLRFNSNKQDAYKIHRLINDAYIWKLTQLNNDSIFIATGRSCFIYNLKTEQLDLLSFKSPTYNSRTFYIDSLNNYWYGTSDGLVILNKAFETKFIINEPFDDKRIAAFCSLDKTKMVIGSKGLYVAELKKNNTFSISKVKEVSDDYFIYCIEKDSKNNFWIGTNDGIIKYNPSTKTVQSFHESDNVQSDVFNSDGAFLSSKGIMYFGGRDGLNYFNPLFVRPNRTVLQPQLISLTYGNQQINTFDSSMYLHIPYKSRNILLRFSTPNYLMPYKIVYKYKLHENEEWKFVNNQTQVNIQSLSPGNYQLHLASSINGKDWFINHRTLFFKVLNPWWLSLWFFVLCFILFVLVIKLLVHLYKQKKEREHIDDAIQYFSNSSFEQNTLHDILWDITSNCVARLGLEECVIYIVHKETKTLHQRAAYGNKSTSNFKINNPIIIPIGKGIVGSVAATGKAEIVADTRKDERYILDDEFRLSEITVPIIYENEVIGIIDSEHKKANFFKDKHLNALTTIASICSVKISKSITKEQLDEVTKKVDILNHQIKEITFLNLRLQMNPHFLFNSLTSIQHLIISQQTNEAYKYLTIFSNFLRSILKFAEQTFISLEDEIKLLRMYISLESLGFAGTLTYKIFVSEEIEEEDVAIPSLLIQPFIENAIWHGLKNKVGEKFFSVTFSVIQDETICCSIYDNGIGRNVTKQINTLKSEHESKAIELAVKRLALLQEKTNRTAYLEIIDEAVGTRVNIYFPYTYYDLYD